jgi:hypothetical protein
MTERIGYCRFCKMPIVRSIGATCNHKGYLIYGPYEMFWQGHDGYEHYKSISPLGQYMGPESLSDNDAGDIIADILSILEES